MRLIRCPFSPRIIRSQNAHLAHRSQQTPACSTFKLVVRRQVRRAFCRFFFQFLFSGGTQMKENQLSLLHISFFFLIFFLSRDEENASLFVPVTISVISPQCIIFSRYKDIVFRRDDLLPIFLHPVVDMA